MKNGKDLRVSPVSERWTAEKQNNHCSSSKQNSDTVMSRAASAANLKRSSIGKPSNGRTSFTENHGSTSKVSTSNVKVAFKDTAENIDRCKEGMNLPRISRSFCLPACFKLEFHSKILEDIYQRHYTRQKLDQILYIIFICLVVNLSLITMYAVVFVSSSNTQVNRVIVTCTFGAVNLLLIAFQFFKLLPDGLLTWLPYFVWCSIFGQLLVDLIVGYDPLAPSDSVGMFMFFTFITYVILPARMPICLALSLIIGTGHLIVIGACAKKDNVYLGRQVS